MQVIRRSWAVAPVLVFLALAMSGCGPEPMAVSCPSGLYCPAGARCAAKQAVCIFDACGNGVPDPGERCDDGNKIDGDGCSANCKSEETCGNGITDTSKNEECDRGLENSDTGPCLTTCKEAQCGDGHIETGVEDCDTGPDSATAKTKCPYGEKTCTACSQCRAVALAGSYCGDRSIDGDHGEACDDGPLNGTTVCEYDRNNTTGTCQICNANCTAKVDAKGPYCGDGRRDTANEACDDGARNGTTTCQYGLSSCEICNADCSGFNAGVGPFCGDGHTDGENREECDNRSDNGNPNCTYGPTSCTVCTALCKKAVGTPHYCGDHRTDAEELCDNGVNNTDRTDCDYGPTQCTFCNKSCVTVSGTPHFCGNTNRDSTEQCDKGGANGTVDCPYSVNRTDCKVCTTNCVEAAGKPHYCGDGFPDASEECDAGGNNGKMDCPYGLTSCQVCTSSCKVAAGSPHVCGDETRDPGEQCDNGVAGNTDAPDCSYGLNARQCTLCSTSCTNYPGIPHYCGDGLPDPGEECDDGVNNTDSPDCQYGLASCKKCSKSCKVVEGTPHYCGDGHPDTGNEACDDAGNNGATSCGDEYHAAKWTCTRCSSDCQKATTYVGQYCGDGNINGGEKCDNGSNNTSSTDCAYGAKQCTLCSLSCKEVPGQAHYCGDGTQDPLEECDDGRSSYCGTCSSCKTVGTSQASGSITVRSTDVDGVWFKIDDGVHPAVTYELDTNGKCMAGRTCLKIAMDSPPITVADVAEVIQKGTSTAGISASLHAGTDGMVDFGNLTGTAGISGNNPITVSSEDVLAHTGMSGGVGCPAGGWCAFDIDCVSNQCVGEWFKVCK